MTPKQMALRSLSDSTATCWIAPASASRNGTIEQRRRFTFFSADLNDWNEWNSWNDWNPVEPLEQFETTGIS
jgi:hypothetical protein